MSFTSRLLSLITNPRVQEKDGIFSIKTSTQLEQWLSQNAFRRECFVREVTADVPKDDYEGWYLQDPGALQDSGTGIFFFLCKPGKSGVKNQLQNHQASNALWRATEKILGQFKDVTMYCGNCEFSGVEWLEVLRRDEAQEDAIPYKDKRQP